MSFYPVCCQVISQLKVLMRSDLEASKFDKEKWSTELSPILNLWKKLNQVHGIAWVLQNVKISCEREYIDLSAVMSQLQDLTILT